MCRDRLREERRTLADRVRNPNLISGGPWTVASSGHRHLAGHAKVGERRFTGCIWVRD